MASNLVQNGAGGIPLVQRHRVWSETTPDVRRRFASALWAPIPQGTYSTPPCSAEPYFEYYGEQCRTAHHSLGAKLSFLDHDAMMDLVKEIKQGATREQLVQSVEQRFPQITPGPQLSKARIIDGVVDLAARLLLMVDVGQPDLHRVWTGSSHKVWAEGSIHDFTKSIFPEQRAAQHDGMQLGIDFNARNLDAIAGLKVEFSNNLLDHLEVIDIEGETTVMIFHHASYLRNLEVSPFPEGFVEETLQTLALLFPQNKWYKETKSWYYKYMEPFTPDADSGVLDCGPLTKTNIDAYRFWHDRLVRLKQVFDEAKPRSLRQWWNDRREGTQWYGLLVAVGFTVFFGLVQSIVGIIQVYKAYHPEP